MPTKTQLPKKPAKLQPSSLEADEKAKEAINTTEEGARGGIEVVHNLQVGGFIENIDKINQVDVKEVAGTHSALHSAVDSISSILHAIDKAAHALQPILHPIGIVLTAVGSIFPPLRAALVGFTSIVGVIKAFLSNQESKTTRARQIILGVIFTGLFIAIAVAPIVAIPLFLAVASISVVRDVIELIESIATQFQLTKQLERQNDLKHYLEIKQGLLQKQEQTTDPAERRALKDALNKLNVKINDVAKILAINVNAENTNGIEAINDKLKMFDRNIAATQAEIAEVKQARNDKIAALVCGVVGLTGIALLLTPLAPLGLGLLILSSAGIIGYKIAPTVIKYARPLIEKLTPAFFAFTAFISGKTHKLGPQISAKVTAVNAVGNKISSTAKIIAEEVQNKLVPDEEAHLPKTVIDELKHPEPEPEVLVKSTVEEKNFTTSSPEVIEQSPKDESEDEGESDSDSDSNPHPHR